MAHQAYSESLSCFKISNSTRGNHLLNVNLEFVMHQQFFQVAF